MGRVMRRGRAFSVAKETPPEGLKGLPPVLMGQATPEVLEKVRRFYQIIAGVFEAWVTRRESPHTQRAYRSDVMDFVRFLGIRWPEESFELLRASVSDVLEWRKGLIAGGLAPKTVNRRVSSLSSFYKYLAGAAAELRLPITVPNPAHAQFIARESSDPREETRALTAAQARRLLALPVGDSLLAYRDRAILKTFLYTGVRIGTACRLTVRDLMLGEGEATLRVTEKGKRRRTIGLHFAAAGAIEEYLVRAGISEGPIFRARLNSRSQRLGESTISPTALYGLILKYLRRIPGALRGGLCLYSPHSLRATTATLLLGAGVDITKVQELLGHRHITTTQIYDKRRRAVAESASHEVPI